MTARDTGCPGQATRPPPGSPLDADKSAATSGFVKAGYKRVVEAFDKNFCLGLETGAACTIFVGGELAVEIWGGQVAPEPATPWQESTLCLVFSASKGVAALACHILVDRAGVNLTRPLRDYWPEFGQGGKEPITPRMVLAHTAGVPTVDPRLSLSDVLSGSAVVESLADATPTWVPGTAVGYHALTFGWLLGELVHRVTGHSLSTFIREEIAEPLGIELFLGWPADLPPSRIASLVGPFVKEVHPLDSVEPGRERDQILARRQAARDSSSLFSRVLTTNGVLPIPDSSLWNSAKIRASEIPAANMITSAAALARMYAACLPSAGSAQLLSSKTLGLATRPVASGWDLVTLQESAFASGFQLPTPSNPMLSRSSFGHAGAGGSLAFADTELDVAFAYVANEFGGRLQGDQPRVDRLLGALRECLETAI